MSKILKLFNIMKPFDFSTGIRKQIIDETLHSIVEGGPGSGKTTVALAKAKFLIESGQLSQHQKILFLSFARATVSRIEEQMSNLITKNEKKKIEISTYHSFCWNIIQSYGYLVSSRKKFRILSPPDLAASLANVAQENRDRRKLEMFNEGTICFDLFSDVVYRILSGSNRITNIISHAYPFIIVDEFQDTDINEWNIIKRLGKSSTILALADLEQRIYDFRGASVTRIPDFIEHFQSKRFDLGKENNRSGDRDIVDFGNDLLTGKNKGKKYEHVKIVIYPYYQGTSQRLPLKNAVINSIRRLSKEVTTQNWSIAILVQSKQDTLTVANYLNSINISHEVIIDPAGPSLAAGIIASMMQPVEDVDSCHRMLIAKVINHVRGRKAKLTKVDTEVSDKLAEWLDTKKLRAPKKKVIIDELRAIVEKRNEMMFTGTPTEDWLAIRHLFQGAKTDCVKEVLKPYLF